MSHTHLEPGDGDAYLERLCIPIRHFPDRRHLVEPVGQGLELLDAVGKPYGELLGEELGGAEEGAWQAANVRIRAWTGEGEAGVTHAHQWTASRQTGPSGAS